MTKLPIYRTTKLELVKACQELERRGWTCVGSITEIQSDYKDFSYRDSKLKGTRDQFVGLKINTRYRAVYQIG